MKALEPVCWGGAFNAQFEGWVRSLAVQWRHQDLFDGVGPLTHSLRVWVSGGGGGGGGFNTV